MIDTPRRLVAAAALLALAACSPEPDGSKAQPANKPKPVERQKNISLLSPPKDSKSVFTSAMTAKDFPGLGIKTLKEGEGEATLAFGKIGVVHIVGRLSSGKEFKNTKKAGTPEELVMMEWGGVKGLVIGALGMKAGEVRQLSVPAELGYGKAGSMADGVQGNAALNLTVELTEIKEGLDENFQVMRAAAGEGEVVQVGQTGMFHYTGVLAEGENAGLVFDSSRTRGQPIPMQVGIPGGMIEGWIKGAMGMRVGEKRWLKIPAGLGYGDGGRGEDIKPGATLIFEMELVSIQG